MLQSFLISALNVRHRASNLAAFMADYSEAWVVWEAGPWIPAGKGKTGMVAVVGSARPPTPVAEVQATHLRADASHPQVTLGRDDSAATPRGPLAQARLTQLRAYASATPRARVAPQHPQQ